MLLRRSRPHRSRPAVPAVEPSSSPRELRERLRLRADLVYALLEVEGRREVTDHDIRRADALARALLRHRARRRTAAGSGTAGVTGTAAAPRAAGAPPTPHPPS